MPKISEILSVLEKWAPPSYQESYDNSQLLTGDKQAECTGALISLDCIEAVVDEAIELKCNLIIAHHPIVFSGLKSFTGKNYIEKTIIKAIKNDIAIYAIHTNLDNVHSGVNAKICDMLGLTNTQILAPKKQQLLKLSVFVPNQSAETVRKALFNAGAGNVGNYDNCSFNSKGEGTFKANANANPTVGKVNELHLEQETKVEVILPSYLQHKVISAMENAHPYEEVAYDVFKLENYSKNVGSGMLGELKNEQSPLDFLKFIKKTMGCSVIKHSTICFEKIKKVAVCGGSGSFLLNHAKLSGAQLFITSDYKYHQFFDAEKDIIIADIGHYESEQFTINLIADYLKENFTTFAPYLTKVNTNPVNYL